MLFNSFDFLVFFPIVTALFFAVPHRERWALLLAASCVFYMFFIPKYLLILAVTIVIDYAAALWIERATGRRKRALLVLSIISTCLVLAVFKYASFFNESFRAAASILHLDYPVPVLNIILPIGLSFHTFQSLSYVIEVYLGRQKAERHFGIYSLYVMFYPQLVAGPIERPQNLLHQFRAHHAFDPRRAADGLKLMAWGLFKKVVIADRLAQFVNPVFGHPGAYKGPSFVMAAVFFAFQIYCDFSGYSDIAIGSAQVMGFRLMENFNRPYSSSSVAEFWKRWHISLSTWFRDYLYIPLGGNRCSQRRRQLNLFVTFVVSGLWHGANWTFVAWGALNGLFLIVERATAGLRDRAAALCGLARLPRLHRALKTFATFCLICFAWIFFRAQSLGDAVHIVSRLFYGFVLRGFADPVWVTRHILVKQPPREFVIAVLSVLFLVAVHFIQRHRGIRSMVSQRPAAARWTLYYALVAGTLIFGKFDAAQRFIYFQF